MNEREIEARYMVALTALADAVQRRDQLAAALTPFAAVGAQVAAIHAARPQSSYAPEHVALTIGGATITFADLQAAAALLAVRAEAVTGGSVGTGISEIMEDAK